MPHDRAIVEQQTPGALDGCRALRTNLSRHNHEEGLLSTIRSVFHQSYLGIRAR
jgi:hypothetical protein